MSTGRQAIFTIESFLKRKTPSVFNIVNDNQQNEGLYGQTLFISGHSHILKVMNDHKNGLLHINPGAAGKSGFHQISTIVRFIIDDENIRDLEILEIPK